MIAAFAKANPWFFAAMGTVLWALIVAGIVWGWKRSQRMTPAKLVRRIRELLYGHW